jgi:hypothetical protein
MSYRHGRINKSVTAVTAKTGITGVRHGRISRILLYRHGSHGRTAFFRGPLYTPYISMKSSNTSAFLDGVYRETRFTPHCAVTAVTAQARAIGSYEPEGMR